jgi:ABC-type nitrate/sulfonate/bicarbonate transport system ATPase subunit
VATSVQPTAASGNGGPHRQRIGDSPGSDASLELTGVRHSYGQVDVLDGIDLTLSPHETVALVGPSGCGKSTLLELIAGLAPPGGGSIAIGGARGQGELLARAVLMPQRDLLLPWLRAIDNAALGLRLGGAPRREARERARPLFRRLGLEGFERARPGELSGGMRQRVAFARTLLTGKPVLLLDEPFAALDAITRADLQSWLLEALAAEPRTVVLVSHDVEEALFVADRTVVLSPRPARPVLEQRLPVDRERDRADVISDPDFVAAREAALHALGGSGR